MPISNADILQQLRDRNLQRFQQQQQALINPPNLPYVQPNAMAGIGLTSPDMRQQTQAAQPDEQSGWYPFKNVLYLGERFLAGGARTIEGLSDLVVGGGAKLFGQDEFAKDMFANSWSGKYSQNIEERYDPNVVFAGIGAVTEAVGGMALPALTGGASIAVLGASAAGQGIGQAVQKTGELGFKEAAYGIGSGLLEAGIEKLSGGIGGLGKGFLDKGFSKVIKNKLIRSMAGEGLEEVASTLIDPLLQRVTYNPDAEGAKVNDVISSFVIGSLASGVMQGGQVMLKTNPQARKMGERITAKNETQDVITEALTLEGT
ncbi:MAG: hypothetical protein EOM87_08135, partial [Clostridia bacterium]|nr:hypothetical protein [Clostridia bacterium]